ncbi:hypothetical protein HD553DRAFT_345736 [Filobasidium floriforme]|uniref:uncharacterized protein n=1 Tax=Filobasidium floriforme TaxID=5210 RepID=UPI001E8CE5C9|nr:uncharacterized protein HD553DRAFT_345736 [Filobasidium floriforme]KAH8079390.1 hypothetical protein HD553DRAFT_345736 [Filobasidium floriforme]
MVFQRSTAKRRTVAFFGATISVITLAALSYTRIHNQTHLGNLCDHLAARSTPLEAESESTNDVPFTKVISHAAGFTVLENAYWKNDTWYFVSEQPWSFPDLASVVTQGPWHGSTPYTDARVVRLITLDEATAMGIQDHSELKGSTLFFNDRIYLDHFYHVVGEMFLGAWRAWQSATWFTSKPNPDIARLAFAHVDDDTFTDHAGMNHYYLERFFPAAELEFVESWEARAKTGKYYRLPKVVIADRKSGHRGPKTRGKPMDDAFALPVHGDWVAPLRQAIVGGYTGAPMPDKGLPVITYLSRQSTHMRKMTQASHENLEAELKKLEQDGIAEFNTVEFSDKDPKDYQAAVLARTTILVGVHGNGLTHLMWMVPNKLSAVYELQQKGSRVDDYSILSEAMNMKHWIVNVDTMCERRDCGPRGLDPSVQIGSNEYTVDAAYLAQAIRTRLAA